MWRRPTYGTQQRITIYSKCAYAIKQTDIYAIEQSKDLSHNPLANSLCGGKTSQLYRKRAVNLCGLLRAIAHLHTVRHNHTFITCVSSFAVLQITNESDRIEQAYILAGVIRGNRHRSYTQNATFLLYMMSGYTYILCEQLGVSV